MLLAPDEFAGSCYYPVRAVDLAQSTALARATRAQPQECFPNAYRAMLSVRGAVYVEGFVANALTPAALEHGWVELLETRTIVDPTPGYCDGSSDTLAYFAGQRWTHAEIRALYHEQPSLTFPLSGYRAQWKEDGGRGTDLVTVQGWRQAVTACHHFRARNFRERFGMPMCPTEAAEAVWLAAELSRWPEQPRA